MHTRAHVSIKMPIMARDKNTVYVAGYESDTGLVPYASMTGDAPRFFGKISWCLEPFRVVIK